MSAIDLKTADFEKTIEENEIVILDFWASWCGPCTQFAPTFKKVAEEHPEIKFVKVNVEEEQELAGMFQVRSIPTLVFMREKIVIFSNPGVLPESNFKKAIKQLVDLDMAQVHKDLAEAQKKEAENS
jgi:thioredoxin 1